MAIQVFGAGAVQSAYVSYLPIDITANSVVLDWPTSYVDLPYTDPSTGIHYNVLAASINVTTGIGNTHTVTLPDATQSGVGQNLIITNVGASAFDLKTSDGSNLINIDTGLSYWIQLTDNETSAGVWSVVQFGAGTSEADANLLAGNGLVALGSKLNTNMPVITTSVAPVMDLTYRAKLIVWEGGATTITLPTIGSIPAGWYVSFNNQGSAPITIQPGEGGTKIDDQFQITVGQNQSLIIVSNGANFYTLGFGQNQFAVTSVLNRDVSASVDVILTNTEAANLIQQYSGALTADIKVFFPATSDYWFVRNLTTGAHKLSVQLVGSVGTTYVIPQGAQVTIYSDGTSLRLISNTIPSPFSISDGNYYLTLGVTAGVGLIRFNNFNAIGIDTSGNISLLNTLALASGGTSASSQQDAAINILPGPASTGDILYFDGTNWVILPIGAPTQVLTVSGGGLPEWV